MRLLMRSLGFCCVVFFALLGSVSVLADSRAVAMQTADLTCKTISDRFVDCSNGTVTDNESGLIWTKNASCWGINAYFTWDEASIEILNLADGFCGLTDGSSPGEWRLPTKAEWERMVAAAVALGNCDPTITNDAGTDCFDTGPSSFTNIIGFEFGFYWSATTDSATTANAFRMNMINGEMVSTAKTGLVLAWAVRGGQ
jgi:hypothetical protein